MAAPCWCFMSISKKHEAGDREQAARGKDQRVSCLLLLASCLLLFVTACAPTSASPLPTATWSAPPLATRTPYPTSAPQPTETVAPPASTPTLLPTVSVSADGWREIRLGVFTRDMLADPYLKTGHVYVVRIDPSQVDFHVRYQPDAPLRVSEWYSNTQALVIINSSFFDSAHHAVGQLTSNGKSDGQTQDLMDGAFYLTAVGAAVWPLEGWKKPEGLQIVESVESFPMLLLPGGLLNPNIASDARVARRTVVAVDRSGNVLFIVTPGGSFTLHGMAIWLANSDLDIDTALNFDGGSSSGIAVWTPTGVWGFDSANRVPAVVTVDTKVTGVLGSGGGEWP